MDGAMNKTQVEIATLMGETAELKIESRWDPVVIAATTLAGTAAVVGAVAALLKVVLG